MALPIGQVGRPRAREGRTLTDAEVGKSGSSHRGRGRLRRKEQQRQRLGDVGTKRGGPDAPARREETEVRRPRLGAGAR